MRLDFCQYYIRQLPGYNSSDFGKRECFGRNETQ